MPNRYLRESILTSEPVNKLGPHAEVFYRRLMSVVDDYGRFEANPKLLRASCYPLRVDEVREADISRWLAEVQAAGLIALYAVNSKNYLEFHKLGEPRAKSSKYPGPCAREDICAQTRTSAPPPPPPPPPPPVPSAPSITPPPPTRARVPMSAMEIFQEEKVGAAEMCAKVKGMNAAEALLLVEYCNSEKAKRSRQGKIYTHATNGFEPAGHITPATACRWAREGKLISICGIAVNGYLGDQGKTLVIGEKFISEKDLLTSKIEVHYKRENP